MASPLRIIAGPKARARLQAQGFQQELFQVLMAASGGPKWFILYGLDCYLFGEFFKHRQQPIHTLGSSAGAWQMSCFGQKDPVAAITRLAQHYSTETYSEKPDVEEITHKARLMVEHMLGATGVAEIVANPVVNTHILADRCRGPVALENRWLQMLGLGLAAGANALSRKTLSVFFERVIFHSGSRSFFAFQDQATRVTPLTEANVTDALMASGAIPLVLKGVSNIDSAPAGVYRDGGIVDYHFDLPLQTDPEALVLYPHFSQKVLPGWFDKMLSYRKVDPRNYDNVVMLTPSPELVSQLPYQKISDRNDFKHLDDSTRLGYWQKVLDSSQRLAEDLDALVHHGTGLDDIYPFPGTT